MNTKRPKSKIFTDDLKKMVDKINNNIAQINKIVRDENDAEKSYEEKLDLLKEKDLLNIMTEIVNLSISFLDIVPWYCNLFKMSPDTLLSFNLERELHMTLDDFRNKPDAERYAIADKMSPSLKKIFCLSFMLSSGTMEKIFAKENIHDCVIK